MKYIKFILITYVVLFVVLFLMQRFILLQPQPLASNYKFNFKKAEEFDIQVADKVKLSGLRFSAKDSIVKGVVLCFNGSTDNLTHWGKFAENFTKRGYDVVMYDYRGFGKSQGRLDEVNFLQDAEVVFYTLARRYNPDQIILYGRFFGAGAAVKIASENAVKKLILENPYYSIPDLAWSQLPIYPYKYFSEFIIPIYEWLPKIRTDIHVFLATHSDFVPYRESVKLLGKINKNNLKTLTVVKGSTDRDIDKYKEFQQKLDLLLK